MELMIAKGDAFRRVFGEEVPTGRGRDRSVIIGGVVGLCCLGLVWYEGLSITMDQGRWRVMGLLPDVCRFSAKYFDWPRLLLFRGTSSLEKLS